MKADAVFWWFRESAVAASDVGCDVQSTASSMRKKIVRIVLPIVCYTSD
jgi:hypothetical protein